MMIDIEELEINNDNTINLDRSETLLGVEIDENPKFNLFDEICKIASKQLNYDDSNSFVLLVNVIGKKLDVTVSHLFNQVGKVNAYISKKAPVLTNIDTETRQFGSSFNKI